MVHLIEFILGAISLTPEIIHAWEVISPYLPKEILDMLPVIESFLISRNGLLIIVVYVLFLFWRMRLERAHIKLDYRFQRNAHLLDIPSANLEGPTGEPTYIFISGKINSSICLTILSLLRCKFLLIFKSPIGIIMSAERQHKGVDIVDDNEPHFLILASDIRNTGTRKIELSFAKDELGNFEGKDQISMKVCVGPKIWWPLRLLLQFINGTLCENKIDID